MSGVPTLLFLADESCDFAVVRALRDAGHDELAIAEFTSQSDDADLIAQAHRDHRILITEDKDFGWLVFVNEANSAGVILVRFPGTARTALVQTILRLVAEHHSQLRDRFVVVAPGQVRITARPGRG